MHGKADWIPGREKQKKKNNIGISKSLIICMEVLCVCSQNRSACCVSVAAWSCPPPGAGSGQLTGREVRGWVGSQTLGLL